MRRDELAAEHAELTAGLRPRYEVHERLGEGACGIVWAATRAEDSRRVAIKFLRSQVSSTPGVRTRFEREIEILGRLEHPHIMELVEAGRLGERPFLIMPRVEGSDLDELLAAGPVDAGRALKWLAQIATAVETAHSRGVIHRDLKPANVLITASDDALVTDFGLASGAGFEELTKTGTFVGTPLYMSPEQFLGASPEASMDVYALASIAYRLFEGDVPFRAADLGALVTAKSIPPEAAPGTAAAGGAGLEDLVLQALEEEPAERPRMVELRAQLARRVADTVTLPPPPEAPPPPKPARRTPAAKPVAAATPPGGAASGAHPLGGSSMTGSYTGPPQERSQLVRRSLGLAVGLALVAVGYLMPGGETAAGPEVASGPPPVPGYTLGLDAGGLEFRFSGPVGRPLVMRVVLPTGDSRRVELGPDEMVADLAWAEFFPDSFTIRLESDTGQLLREETRSLALQALEASQASGSWGPSPVARGDEAWLPRGAGGFDRLVPRAGKVEVAGAVDPSGGWGRVGQPTRREPGGFLALSFEPGRQVLLVAGPQGPATQVELPGNLPRYSRAFELGPNKVLLTPDTRKGGEVPPGKLLEVDTGVMRDVPFPPGFDGVRSLVATTRRFVMVLLRRPDEHGRLHILRWEGEDLVEHAALLGSSEVVDEGEVADAWRSHKSLGAVPERDLGAVWFGYDLVRVAAGELAPGVHDLTKGAPPGVTVTSMAESVSRGGGDLGFVVEGETLVSATMARVPGTAESLQVEEFALTRFALGDPEAEPEIFFRHRRGQVPHMGTWSGKTRVMRDPVSGYWLAAYETDRFGSNLLLVGDDGELRYWRQSFEAERWGRIVPLRTREGVFLGEPDKRLWYVPLWTHPRGDRP